MQGNTGERPIRCLIVDDDPLIRSAMTMVIGTGSGGTISVVGQAADGSEAITEVQAHHPDVVLMDVKMPTMDGLSATRHIRTLPNAPEVIIITTFDADDEPILAAHAGASGFLLKSEDPADIIAAITAVAAGEGALSRRTAKQLLSHVGSHAHDVDRHTARTRLQALTQRERAVADLVARGLSNAEIAGELFLSESTVKTHLSAVQDKLGVGNRVHVAVEVTKAG